MDNFAEKAHAILVGITPGSVLMYKVYRIAEAGVYAVLALVEELREIRECMQEEQAYRARGL